VSAPAPREASIALSVPSARTNRPLVKSSTSVSAAVLPTAFTCSVFATVPAPVQAAGAAAPTAKVSAPPESCESVTVPSPTANVSVVVPFGPPAWLHVAACAAGAVPGTPSTPITAARSARRRLSRMFPPQDPRPSLQREG
jgi:hypothetical protein